MLYIISTPIGNMDDMTYRGVKCLKQCDIIVAEDTRTTGKLLKHYEIEKKQYISYNDFNSNRKIPEIMQLLKEGKEIGLVSENGTPCISDPGFKLVRKCIEEDIKVTAIPGATAGITALVISGLTTDSFTFHGFLPKTKGKKENIFSSDDVKKRTSIFYESPHRILKTAKILSEIIPNRKICVARELTKKFEETINGTAKEVFENLNQKNRVIKGEFVLIIDKEEKVKKTKKQKSFS